MISRMSRKLLSSTRSRLAWASFTTRKELSGDPAMTLGRWNSGSGRPPHPGTSSSSTARRKENSARRAAFSEPEAISFGKVNFLAKTFSGGTVQTPVGNLNLNKPAHRLQGFIMLEPGTRWRPEITSNYIGLSHEPCRLATKSFATKSFGRPQAERRRRLVNS